MEWILISWPTLILLGLGLRMALRLTYGVRGPDPNDPVHDFLIVTSWVLIVLGLAPVIIGGLYSIVGGIVVFLMAITFIEAITQRRAAQRRSVATLIAVLISRRQRLDASAFLETQAMRGRVGRQAKRLFQALNDGTTLVKAIRTYPGALPDEAIAFLAAGPSVNARSAALRELSQSDQNEMGSVWRAFVDRVTYLAIVVSFIVLVMTFIMIKIVPAYRDIFQEFRVDLPPMTELAVVASGLFVNYLAVPVIVCVVAAFLIVNIVGLCYLLDFPVLRPFSDRLFRGRRLAEILRILAVATQERQPLAEVLNRLAFVYPSKTIRRQLARAAKAVSDGADWVGALSHARIIRRAEMSLLRIAERAGNLPWALRQLARRRDKRAVYRLAAGVQIAYPIIILSLAAVVGFFVISMFVPIVKLIAGMSM